MSRKNKIQHLLVSHLLSEGHIELLLPDGMTLELGIVQEGNNGSLLKQDDYCWVIASQRDRTISMDSYNLGLRFSEDDDKIVFEDQTLDRNGEGQCILSVI
jgi:hypothetical protein